MAKVVVSDACFRCGECAKACPAPGTITSILPGPVRINAQSCIGCSFCVDVCPAHALRMDDQVPLRFSPDPNPVIDTFSLGAVVMEPMSQSKSGRRRRR